MCERFPNCCPTYFASGLDGMHRVFCAGGRKGGCEQLASFDQIMEQDREIGSSFGARSKELPLWRTKYGQVFGPSWEKPRILRQHKDNLP